jgi:hypothetical protein
MTTRARPTSDGLLACALTLAAWGLARSGGTGRAPEAAAVLVLAAIKVRCITRDFMNVRTAPRWLRRFTDGWIVGLAAMLMAIVIW